VKNEQNTILKSIKSLKKLADEIIVVDTGSTDETIEILTNYSMNDTSISLYSFEWCDDFSRARNFANSKASCDWIVSLDA
ncbi:glycosyltransferase, partial [Enterococcus faecium]